LTHPEFCEVPGAEFSRSRGDREGSRSFPEADFAGLWEHSVAPGKKTGTDSHFRLAAFVIRDLRMTKMVSVPFFGSGLTRLGGGD
jgi:hypothetical protein